MRAITEGDTKKITEALQRLVASYDRAFGPNSLSLALEFRKFAAHMINQPKEALAISERALAIFEKWDPNVRRSPTHCGSWSRR